MNILVIRLGAIGDVVLTSPAILNLKIAYPESKLFFLTRSSLVSLADKIKGVDETLEFPAHASMRDLFLMGEYLDKIGFDMIVDLHGNLRSKYLMKHINASSKVQYPKRRFERISAVRFNKVLENVPHTIDLYNSAVEKCDAKIYARRPLLSLTEKTDLVFDNPSNTVAIAPGASYPTKQWAPEKFKELAINLNRDYDANILTILTSADREYFESLLSEINENRLKLIVDEPLENLPEIISHCSLLVANDSGLAHIGSAAGTPVVAIFGPTHPTLGFAPRGLHDVVVEVDEKCRPCSLHGKRKCFRSEQFCFNRIEVSDVANAVNNILENQGKREKALFIDRDGALIIDKNYLFDPDQVEPEEGSFEAVRLARKAGYKIIIVTNQSGVARGYFDEESVEAVNSKMLELFAENNAPIDAVYYCPHLVKGAIPKYSVNCDCRKPSPGMIEKACLEHSISLTESYMVGDKISDINLGHIVGAKTCLVKTGYGQQSEESLVSGSQLYPDLIKDNLLDFVKSLP